MLFQSVLDANFAEKGFRVVQNSATATGTITAGSIAINSPVILETNTASLPSTVSTNGQNFVTRPVTSTSLANNLFVGILAKGPRTTFLDREEIGLAQCYGPYVGAIVRRDTAGASVGAVLVPEAIQGLIAVVGPVNVIGTGSNIEQPALGGLAILMQALATSGATETTTAVVFLRAL